MNYFGYQKNSDLTLLRFLISETLHGQNDTFKEDLETILTQTSAFVKGSISNFQIKNDYYQLIYFLSKSDAEFFRHLGPHPTPQDYLHVEELLKKQEAINAFL